MTKSYVSMEQQVCRICGKLHDTGALLLDKRLRESMERTTLTGVGQCPDCTEKLGDGERVALVAIDPDRSVAMENGNYAPGDAHRTGRIAFLSRAVWEDIFNVPMPEGSMAFVEDGVLDILEQRSKRDE